ncbi:hypothetical protein [Sulfurovum sp. bin170]|uniref:hypothetical protein n=1 Tax=Sulfurovum sp. bin170 TaxID=2695268 RepID=UPI0013DE8733|nr:hypothetical protein [Sulfurovum sp. bin170]
MDLKVDGHFQKYDFGIRFQPLEVDYQLGWFTISPRFYATLGYRYTAWDLDDIHIDISGMNISSESADFSMNSKVGYFGVGYSF